MELLMSSSAGKGNSCPVDQRNLLGINSIYLQVQLLCKRLLVGPFLLTAAGAVFNNLFYLEQSWQKRSLLSFRVGGIAFKPPWPQRLRFNPLVAGASAPDTEYLEALGTGCRNLVWVSEPRV